LEWPIVIPINMTGTPQLETALVHDRRSNSFSVPVLGVAPTAYADLRSRSEQELARERVRLWYVATTRPRDLLILPRHSAKLPDNSWAQIVDFKLASLNGIGSKIGPGKRIAAEPQENVQTRETFTAEAAGIAQLRGTIVWQRPSRDEADGASAPAPLPLFENPEDAEQLAEIPEPTIAGSSTRGLILHKLIEEILTGELRDCLPAIEQRALELLAQLGIEPVADPKDGISPTEISGTIIRTLSLPEIVQLRSQLVPEHTVFGHQTTAEGEVLVSGIADAIARDAQGEIDAVIDWKSDVTPSPERIDHYRKQIDDYRRHTGAKWALLVFMTLGKIIEVG
jgi:ATP-dependent exoDNAse (exonuclease V) beta subunit